MIATLLKEHRQINKLSLREMAKILHVDFTVLCRFEAGKSISEANWCRIVKWMLVGAN